ncbi:DUF485 domain-containing protein [Streptomyces sp. RPT161]|uniref:DUF485 domain-containing protein n=1 Tax=Streptomyces sp. RPT161 TaxID=3015993 RepID=UPI0022B88779|nr:DUF485 domain-containing protein [Streptomyces sp. RPT161]
MDVHDGGGAVRLGVQDPWTEALAVGPWEEHGGPSQRPEPGAAARGEPDRTAVYRQVQAGEAFQEVRRRYRRFAFPAAGACLVCYLLYVTAAITAPGLMGRPVAGAVNVAMLAGLAQFAMTFLLTWAYARHARLRRDRAALELRWDTQERVR